MGAHRKLLQEGICKLRLEIRIGVSLARREKGVCPRQEGQQKTEARDDHGTFEELDKV